MILIMILFACVFVSQSMGLLLGFIAHAFLFIQIDKSCQVGDFEDFHVQFSNVGISFIMNLRLDLNAQFSMRGNSLSVHIQ